MSIRGDRKNDSGIWDSVASYFAQKGIRSLEYLPGKENYDIIWPLLFQVIKDQVGSKQNSSRKIFDFGCGTGIFAESMHQIGCDVFACDISKEMIDLAYSFTQGDILYDVGSLEVMQKYFPYEMVISIMVFQFIPNLERVIEIISSCLEENGVLFFAVHNNEYVNECMRYGIKFRVDGDCGLPVKGEILIGNKWITTYIRNIKWYDDILRSQGFMRLGDSLEGVKAPSGMFDIDPDWKSAKYYIAWYKKKS